MQCVLGLCELHRRPCPWSCRLPWRPCPSRGRSSLRPHRDADLPYLRTQGPRAGEDPPRPTNSVNRSKPGFGDGDTILLGCVGGDQDAGPLPRGSQSQPPQWRGLSSAPATETGTSAQSDRSPSSDAHTRCPRQGLPDIAERPRGNLRTRSSAAVRADDRGVIPAPSQGDARRRASQATTSSCDPDRAVASMSDGGH